MTSKYDTNPPRPLWNDANATPEVIAAAMKHAESISQKRRRHFDVGKALEKLGGELNKLHLGSALGFTEHFSEDQPEDK